MCTTIRSQVSWHWNILHITTGKALKEQIRNILCNFELCLSLEWLGWHRIDFQIPLSVHTCLDLLKASKKLGISMYSIYTYNLNKSYRSDIYIFLLYCFFILIHVKNFLTHIRGGTKNQYWDIFYETASCNMISVLQYFLLSLLSFPEDICFAFSWSIPFSNYMANKTGFIKMFSVVSV